MSTLNTLRRASELMGNTKDAIRFWTAETLKHDYPVCPDCHERHSVGWDCSHG